jgi:hypothetical protein
LVSIWRHLALCSGGRDKSGRRNGSRERLAAYLAGPVFLASFAALDPARRVLALQAVSDAFARLASPEPASLVRAPRVRWTAERVAELREAAARCKSDRELARVLGLPVPKTKIARWTYCGRRGTHINTPSPLQLAA